MMAAIKILFRSKGLRVGHDKWNIVVWSEASCGTEEKRSNRHPHYYTKKQSVLKELKELDAPEEALQSVKGLRRFD